MEKKKIGIITHHYICNYGAFLQTYALQETIKRIVPESDVRVINYVKYIHAIKNKLGWFRYNSKKDSFSGYIKKIRVPKIFKDTQKKYLNLTKKVKNVGQLNRLGFDDIIIGSDEVWNYEDIANDKIKFGNGIVAKKIISYAPSTGKSNVKDNIPDYVVKGLNKFTGLSARDDNTEQLIKNVTKQECCRVLDPTFLYKFPLYESDFVNYIKNERYILMYYCDNISEEMIKQIKDIAKENGFKIYGAGEEKKWFDKSFIDINPFEWVEMFRNAQLVFTGTFHGVVFSIKAQKEFYCYLTNPSRVEKVNSLLNQFEIKNRIIKDGNIEKSIEKIDYNKVNRKIEEWKNISEQYLINNI